jgi:hypothetical protein
MGYNARNDEIRDNTTTLWDNGQDHRPMFRRDDYKSGLFRRRVRGERRKKYGSAATGWRN